MRLGVLLFLIVAVWASVPADPPVTDIVTFDIKQSDKLSGQLKLGMFGTVAPVTVENFVCLASGTKGYGFQNSTFHRIIKDFMIQGGDFENHDGTGGYSIYGETFPDETFELKHDRPGRVSMANRGPNTGGSQFFITTGLASWLDGRHVVFGQLLEGQEFLEQIQSVATNAKDKPLEDIVIVETHHSKPETSVTITRWFDDVFVVFLVVSFILMGGAWAIRKIVNRNQDNGYTGMKEV